MPLDEWGVHPCLSAALLFEACEMSAIANCDTVQCKFVCNLVEACEITGIASFDTVPCKFVCNRSLRQGSVEAGRLFAAVMMSVISPSEAAWQEQGLGIFIGSRRMNICVYADNF